MPTQNNNNGRAHDGLKEEVTAKEAQALGGHMPDH